jgi:hypothetical protein
LKHGIGAIIERFIERDGLDSLNRYRSWSHCYRAFAKPAMDDDALSLHLAFFLASWGMYRGSSFLLQKDYTVHRPAVKLLRSPEHQILRGATTTILRKHFEKILDLQNNISNAYVAELERSNWVNGERRKVTFSDILVTKILLGTPACMPAFDRYFLMGAKICELSFSKLNKQSLFECCDFYDEHSLEFSNANAALKLKGFDFPPMRSLDLYLWELGFNSAQK